jgi:ABC-2 type transport system ATP-binding protein
MSVIRIEKVSRWYGNVVAVNDVTMTIGPGVTGLLGPNGAGKSTLITMMAGFLPPSVGAVTLDGVPVWRNEDAYRQLGLVPETEAVYDTLSGAQFVRANADLQGLDEPGAAADRAIAIVAMQDAAGPGTTRSSDSADPARRVAAPGMRGTGQRPAEARTHSRPGR